MPDAASDVESDVAPAPAGLGFLPTRRLLLSNFVVFQVAWFAAVLGAAHGLPLWGTACVMAAIAWHLSVAERPAVEARLVGMTCVIGLAIETMAAMQGHIAYPSGQPFANLAPYWMVALWGLLAISLNVTLRWLKRRLWLAAAIGAVAGPLAFVSGVKLGGASFIDARSALLTMALTWAAVMPLLMQLSNRWDGVATVPGAPGAPEAARG